MSNSKILFLLLLTTNQLVYNQACKPLWDNSCASNGDCCSGFCDNNNGQWAFGVCKTGSGQCKPLWDNSCASNADCCSGFCDNNNGQWAFGVCKQGSGSIQSSTSASITGGSGSLVSQNEFERALVTNGYPQPNSIQYYNLVNQAGSKGNIYSKLELAMFLSQIMWESDGLRAMREYYCYPTFNSGCAYSTGIGFPGQNYFGRGYIQLVSLFCFKLYYINLFFVNIELGL